MKNSHKYDIKKHFYILLYFCSFYSKKILVNKHLFKILTKITLI